MVARTGISGRTVRCRRCAVRNDEAAYVNGSHSFLAYLGYLGGYETIPTP